MLAIMVLPALLMTFHESGTYVYAVVDHSGQIADKLKSSKSVVFLTPDEPIDSLKADDAYAGVLIIGENIVENPTNLQLYNHGPGVVDVEKEINSQIKSAIESIRLNKYNIQNLNEILLEINATPQITTFRIDEGVENSALSSTICYIIGISIAFILYMFLLKYGYMVMSSIIEEKNNRVLEIVVSSVKPEHLMLGKIIGIGLVAITQIFIWVVLLGTIITLMLPSVIPADLMSEVYNFGDGVTEVSGNYNHSIVQALSILGNIGYLLKIFLFMTLFLIGGFLLYASIYAAIGSSVDNVQDAAQLQSLPTIPIIIAFVCVSTIGTDPNSTLAVWLSMIPFTSPMIMMVRVPFGIPTWEVWISIALLYASFFAMIWFAAKIYRVGIFMYGKKPTWKELIKWSRYK